MPSPASRVLAAGLAVVAMSFSVLAHPEHGDSAKTVTVEPVRDAAGAREILDAEREHLPKASLSIGMKAPELAIAHWVKGESIDRLDNGRTHVVEFWARWCTPCIRAFPHLSELQKEHADDLTILGVNIWDPRNPGSETVAQTHQGVDEFVTKQGDRMAYTVAVEERGQMADNWMRAAGQTGIPAAFIVDKTGTVAWIGNPGDPADNMDDALEQIISGGWDYAAAAERHNRGLETGYWYQHLMGLLVNEATAERGYTLAYALLRSPVADETGMLNAISWNILTSPRIPVRDRDLAIAMAAVAAEKTGWEDASVLDTLARGYFDKGDHAKAIELQTKAVAVAGESPMVKDLQATLDRYTAAARD